MPRPGPRRPQVMVRMSEAGIARVDERAARRGVNRSEMLRLMVAYADLHMPENWQPRKAADNNKGAEYLVAGFRGSARINVVWAAGAAEHGAAIAKMEAFAEDLLALAEEHGFSVPKRDVVYSVEPA